MASTIKVDKLEGSTGSTITVPTGQSLALTDGLAPAQLQVVTVAKGGTNIASFTAGDFLYATGSTTLAKLTASGHGSKTLMMNSGATAPEWINIAAGDGTPMVSAYENADQTIGNATWSKVGFDTEHFDSDSAFASDRFTVPSGKAGKYYIEVHFQATYGGTTSTQTQFRKNGTNFVQSHFYNHAGTPQFQQNMASILNLAVADYIEFWLYHDKGSGLVMRGGGSGDTRINITRLGA